MVNFLKETTEVLSENGKTFDDVLWVGSSDGYIEKDLFLKLANINYDNGYGGQEIAQDLLIVGQGWWLERGGYDGSEWWEFKVIPTKPKEKLNPVRLHKGIWTNLKQMESQDNDD